MSEEKKNNPEKKDPSASKKENDKLDRELEQTFPASDPPSHSRPGNDRTETEKDR